MIGEFGGNHASYLYGQSTLLLPVARPSTMGGAAPSKIFNPVKDLPSMKGKVVLVTGSRFEAFHAQIRIMLTALSIVAVSDLQVYSISRGWAPRFKLQY